MARVGPYVLIRIPPPLFLARVAEVALLPERPVDVTAVAADPLLGLRSRCPAWRPAVATQPARPPRWCRFDILLHVHSLSPKHVRLVRQNLLVSRLLRQAQIPAQACQRRVRGFGKRGVFDRQEGKANGTGAPRRKYPKPREWPVSRWSFTSQATTWPNAWKYSCSSSLDTPG